MKKFITGLMVSATVLGFASVASASSLSTKIAKHDDKISKTKTSMKHRYIDASPYAPHAFVDTINGEAQYVTFTKGMKTYFMAPGDGSIHSMAKPMKKINLKSRGVESKIIKKINTLTGQPVKYLSYNFSIAKNKKSYIVEQRTNYMDVSSLLDTFKVTERHVYLIGHTSGQKFLID